MRFATRQEIEYLVSQDTSSIVDVALIDEMTRQLDALRRFDQYHSRADWRPACNCGGSIADSNRDNLTLKMS